jgi:hypothetical protein
MRRRRNEVREHPRVCGGFLSDVPAFSDAFIRASPGIASCPNIRRPVSAAAGAHDELDVENLATWAWPPPADEAVEGLHRAIPISRDRTETIVSAGSTSAATGESV